MRGHTRTQPFIVKDMVWYFGEDKITLLVMFLTVRTSSTTSATSLKQTTIVKQRQQPLYWVCLILSQNLRLVIKNNKVIKL